MKNAATALAALSVVQEHGYSIPDQALMEGFAAVRFPARMELLSENPLVFWTAPTTQTERMRLQRHFGTIWRGAPWWG